jgi:hypothetical protein
LGDFLCFFHLFFENNFIRKNHNFQFKRAGILSFFLRGKFKGKMWKDCVVKWGKSGRNVEREWVDKISDCVGGISSGISDCVGMELDGFQIV